MTITIIGNKRVCSLGWSPRKRYGINTGLHLKFVYHNIVKWGFHDSILFLGHWTISTGIVSYNLCIASGNIVIRH